METLLAAVALRTRAATRTTEDPEAALVDLRRALVIIEREAADSAFVADVANLMGDALRTLGRFDEALAIDRRALAIMERLAAPEKRELGVTLGDVGDDLAGLDRLDEAIPQFQRAVTVLEQSDGPSAPFLINPLLGLGRADLRLGKTAAALASLRRAAAIADSYPDPFFKGMTHFALAEATRDRPLAERAMGELEVVHAQRELTKVKAWLEKFGR
jgi:tetratricopeptide (TPR) repeat protein